MNAEEFLAVQRQIEDVQPTRRAHPKGWEPGIDTAAGVVTVKGGDNPPSDWSVIIRELGLDPAIWTVDESAPVQVRTWDSGEQRCFYYRATVIPASQNASVGDLDALVRAVQRRRGKSPQNASEGATSDSGSRALVVCLADWQAGKSDNGGVEALLERLFALQEAVPARIKQLKKAGRPVDCLYVVGMGDMVENCSGHYAMQEFGVQLTLREQTRLVRRMLTEMLALWSKQVPRVVVAAVPGNHGENRRNGKAFTSFEDNLDVAVFEQVQEILDRAGYDNLSWAMADGDMTVTLDICGTVVGFAHGHQMNGAGLPLAKARRWWQGKQSARHPIGDADVLVYGHYHHLQCLQDGPRTIFGCPSNDGGSRWFEEQGGPKTACGTLSFTADKDGWDDLQVL